MNKKTKILIVCAIVIIILICIIKNMNRKEKNEDGNNYNYNYDNVANEYVIYNSDGEEITRTPEEAMIKIYQEDPNYDTGRITDKDFIDLASDYDPNF